MVLFYVELDESNDALEWAVWMVIFYELHNQG